jgi:hypothetical protein
MYAKTRPCRATRVAQTTKNYSKRAFKRVASARAQMIIWVPRKQTKKAYSCMTASRSFCVSKKLVMWSLCIMLMYPSMDLICIVEVTFCVLLLNIVHLISIVPTFFPCFRGLCLFCPLNCDVIGRCHTHEHSKIHTHVQMRVVVYLYKQ